MSQNKANEKQNDRDAGQSPHIKTREILKVLIVFVTLLGLFIFGLLLLGLKEVPNIAALLFSLAFFCLGGLGGFLFGIPRIKSSTALRQDTMNEQRGLEPNTNLEQVSDWLTKIIVGVTLVQLHEIPGLLRSFGSFAGAAFSYNRRIIPGMGFGAGATTAVASLLFFSANGFLVGYLVTRLILQEAFSDADKGLSPEQIYREQTVAQEDKDATAFTEAQAYLSSTQYPGSEERASLEKKIKQTSYIAKENIFQMSRAQRQRAIDSFKAYERRYMLERTVDVFEALQQAETKFKDNYRIYAELGYAFVELGRLEEDSQEQKTFFQKALENLNDAEKKLRKEGVQNQLIEFYRALARIGLKEGLQKIQDDLKTAYTGTFFNQRISEYTDLISQNSDLVAWLKKNYPEAWPE